MIDHSNDHNYILKECHLTKQLELDNEKLRSEKKLLKKEITDLKGQLFFYEKQNTRIKSVKLKLSETIAELKVFTVIFVMPNSSPEMCTMITLVQLIM